MTPTHLLISILKRQQKKGIISRNTINSSPLFAIKGTKKSDSQLPLRAANADLK